MIKQKLSVLVLLLFAGLLFYTASSIRYPSYTVIQKRQEVIAGALDHDHSLAQSFVADRPNLCAVKLLFILQRPLRRPTVITVSLRENIDGPEIASRSFEAKTFDRTTDFTFSFRPQTQSQGRTYVVVIETDAPNPALSLAASKSDSYLDGMLYVNQKAGSRDLTFSTYYRPTVLEILGDLVSATRRMGWLLIFLLVYLFVGFLGYVIFSDHIFPAGGNALITVVVLPAAIFPLIAFLLGLVKIRLTLPVVLVALAMITVLAAIRFTWKWRSGGKQMRTSVTFSFKGLGSPSNLALFGLFILALFTRLLQIKEIYVPNWMDGITHQQILEQIATGVASNQFYHTGFHGHVLMIGTLLGIDLPEATLLTGQWLSVLSGLTFLVLARRILHSERFALAGLIFYWFLSPFPAYLLSWGRYPFLQGLVLLPLAVLLAVDWLKGDIKSPWLAGVFLTALALSHYGSLVFWLAFILASLLFDRTVRFKAIFSDPASRQRMVRLAGLGAAGSLVLGLKLVPFLINQNLLAGILANTRSMIFDQELLHTLQLTLVNTGGLVWLAGATGLLLAFKVRRNAFKLALGWIAIGLVLTALQYLVLGSAASSLVNNVVFLSIPLCLLAGLALEIIFDEAPAIQRPGWRWITPGFSILLAVAALLGAYGQGGIVNPICVLYNRYDQLAMTWIRTETKPEARFLIDAFHWGNSLRPTDGGGWIEAQTGRPVFSPSKQEDYANMNEIPSKVDYLYAGNGFGFLDINLLEDSGRFSLVFQNDSVRIYQAISP